MYLKLHPETANGATGAGRPKVRQLGEADPVERFTTETAAASGRSERAVQRDNERGEKVTGAALDKVAGTPLDSGAYLDRLKDVPAAHYRRQEPAPPTRLGPSPCLRWSAVLPLYKLHRFHRLSAEGEGSDEDIRDVEVATDAQAILVAQAVAAEPEERLLAVQLRDIDGRVLWRITRGDTISQRPDDL